jgi:hypothetical protein
VRRCGGEEGADAVRMRTMLLPATEGISWTSPSLATSSRTSLHTSSWSGSGLGLGLEVRVRVTVNSAARARAREREREVAGCGGGSRERRRRPAAVGLRRAAGLQKGGRRVGRGAPSSCLA